MGKRLGHPVFPSSLSIKFGLYYSAENDVKQIIIQINYSATESKKKR
jgi:hypothetical protein